MTRGLPLRLLDPGRPAACTVAALIAGVLVARGLLPNSGRPLQVLSLVALLSAWGWLGWRGAGALVPRAGLASRLVCALTLAAAGVACVATFLGHFGWLRPGPFLLGSALLFALGLCLPRMPIAAGDPVAPLRLRSLPGLERALLAAAAVALALRVGGSILHVVRDPDAFLLYDDLSYHLSAVATCHRSADLRTMKFETGDPSPTFYPLVSELCSWALLAPFGDCDLLARRVQLPFALGSLLGVAAVAHRLGLGRRSSLLAALLYAGIDRAYPVLALGAGNDHATAFFTLAAIDGSLAFWRTPGRRSAAYVGVALGLLIGTKYIGLFAAATVLAMLIVHWIVALRDQGAGTQAAATRANPAPAIQVVATIAALMAVCGGYAYARNAWTAGNPVFPAPVSLFGHQLLAGWGVATLEWRRHLPEFRIDTLSFLTRRPDLFGPLFPWTMLLASLLAPALALWRRRTGHAAVLALPLVLFLEFRFLIHDHRDVRYILAALALAAVATAWLLETAGPAIGGLLRMAALAAILFVAVGHFHASAGHEAVLLLLFAATGALGATAAGRARAVATGAPGWATRLPWRAAAVAGGLGLAMVAAWAGGQFVVAFQSGKLAQDRAALALERAAPATGAAIAYVGSNEPYLFFGSRLQNDLQIVPTDGDLAAQYYVWGGSVHFPFDGGSLRRWRANLLARGVRFVVAARNQAEGPERAWMAASPQEFAPIFQDARTEIWRFAPPRACSRSERP